MHALTAGMAPYMVCVLMHSNIFYLAAALSYSVARACAEGRMTKCQCASERRPETARQAWRWGGCSDNVKVGIEVTVAMKN